MEYLKQKYTKCIEIIYSFDRSLKEYYQALKESEDIEQFFYNKAILGNLEAKTWCKERNIEVTS